jgi:hypothetical protein
MIRTFVLTFHRSLELTPNPIPIPLAQLSHTHALVHVGEYAQTIRALALNTHAAPSNETMGVLCLPHPFVKGDFPPFINDFHLEMEVILDWKTFISTLAYSPCLSSSGPLYMVYELLRNYFVLDDYASGFNLLFEICEHIA